MDLFIMAGEVFLIGFIPVIIGDLKKIKWLSIVGYYIWALLFLWIIGFFIASMHEEKMQLIKIMSQ